MIKRTATCNFEYRPEHDTVMMIVHEHEDDTPGSQVIEIVEIERGESAEKASERLTRFMKESGLEFILSFSAWWQADLEGAETDAERMLRIVRACPATETTEHHKLLTAY